MFLQSMFDKNNFASSGTDELNRVLVEILCRQKPGLKVIHFNARSMNCEKLDYVKSVFEDSQVDLICITETWFRDGIPDTYYNMKNYNLYRHDRCNRIGGGVAIYCKSNLNAKLLSCSGDSEIEFLNLEVYDQLTKVFVSCVYNPNRNYSVDLYFNKISTFLIDYDTYVICGDLNVNLLLSDSKVEILKNLIASSGLDLVNLVVPTRYANNVNSSLLDVFLVSDSSIVLLYDQLSFISDHDLCFCTLNVKLNDNHTTSDILTFRDFKRIDFRLLLCDVMALDWSDAWYECNVNTKLEKFVSKVQLLYDIHVPIRSIKIQNKACPWYSKEVKVAINNRSKLYHKWKRNPTQAKWLTYKAARNHAVQCVRNSKSKFFQSKLNPLLPSKALWNNLRNFGVCSKNDFKCNIDPNILNDYFLSSSRASCLNVPTPDFNECEINVVNSPQEFVFIPVSEIDVANSVKKVKSNAVGEDGVSIRFLKLILPYILSPLTHIINHCFTTSVFPLQWKLAQVIPRPKKPLAADPSLFRPISILPCLSKVCENLMSIQIFNYITTNNFLSPLQSGFRPNHSCSTAMIKILDDIRVPYDQNELTMLCLLDFSKAFDSVDHHLLCLKLKRYFNFSKSAVFFLESYLSGRLQRVCNDGKFSERKLLDLGVPQGSILGPLLFSMFINDVFSVCANVNMHAYADDLQIYLSRPIGLVEDLCVRINDDLSRINVWAISNKLMLNPLKSFVLPVCRTTYSPSSIPAVYLGNTALTAVEKIKNLGYLLNTKLTCVDHINSVVKNIFLTLRNLRLSAVFIPTVTKLILAKQLILPFINFFVAVYSKLDSQSMHKLEVAINNVTRYIYGIRRYDHLSYLRNNFIGCNLDNFLKIRNCVYLHNILYTRAPEYLCTKLQRNLSQRSLNLTVPSFRHLNSSRFFFIHAARLWNSLPRDAKNITSKDIFKKAVLNFFSL